MERINRTLNQLSGAGRFQELYENTRREVMESGEVRQFLDTHKDELQEKAVEQGLTKLYEYATSSKGCGKCDSLEGCKNAMQGYEPELLVTNGYIDLAYKPCRRKVASDERKRTEKLIQSVYVPKDVLRATFDSVEIDAASNRLEVVETATDTVDRILADSAAYKGLFIHGDFGVGKSYVLGAIANELKKENKPSYILYFPEFLREMKQAISDKTFAQKIEAAKKASVLMIDDIGAETISSWARDEVLGTILQYRMAEELPTFFTSNFSYDELEHHLTYSQRGEEEPIKAARIMERIKYLTTPLKMEGRNRRG